VAARPGAATARKPATANTPNVTIRFIVMTP
jgi:hypothetical protein